MCKSEATRRMEYELGELLRLIENEVDAWEALAEEVCK